MTPPGWLTLNAFVLLVDAMLLCFVLRKRVRTLQDRSYARLLAVVLLLLVADSVSRVTTDLVPGFPLAADQLGTYLIFVGDPLGYLFALAYIDSWISPSSSGRMIRGAVFGVCVAYVAVNFAAVTASALAGFGWFYSYTPQGLYVRGPLYVPRGILNMLFCLVVGLYALLRRADIRERYRSFILAFPLIVLFSGFLQVFVGGAAYEYAGTVFACLLLFFYVQDRNMDVDYLTGILNRRGIDRELALRAHGGRRSRPFVACMIDLDFFKSINDEHGHDAGDEALRLMSDLLGEAFDGSFALGRWGGDEFIVISDSASAATAGIREQTARMEDGIGRLRGLCERENGSGARAWTIDFSAGYGVFDPAGKDSDLHGFIARIDARMYEEKAARHALRATPAP